jgi:hypothetical protein
MVEIWIFGALVATLPSGGQLVLLLVALSSVTYLGLTIVPALGASPDGARRARRLGLVVLAAALAVAAATLRVGAPGSGGELVPSLALAVAGAAAAAATSALGALGAGSAALRLGAARSAQEAALRRSRVSEKQRLEASRLALLEGDDVREEVASAEVALGRLGAALEKLAATEASVEAKLAELPAATREGPIGRELAETRDAIAARLSLGRQILEQASASAFRLACGAPIRILVRRRPRELGRKLRKGGEPDVARVRAAVADVERFLAEALGARAALSDLEPRRPPPGGDPAPDPLAQARAELGAIEEAFRAVRERLAVVEMRSGARADIDAVASAAGEASEAARAKGVPARDRDELVSEVARADAAIAAATHGDAELESARSLSDTLARSTAALAGDAGDDDPSLEDLLHALREVG